MDMEAATAAADPSSNPFAAPFKASPAPDTVPSPDGLHPSDGLHSSDGDVNNHHHDNDDSAIQDDDDGMGYRHDLHHSHHNGHGANDIMTSSFYGNGDGNRDLFGDPEDLGPETHVDLLDDDGAMDIGQAAEEEYKARLVEFGMENVAEDQHGGMRHDFFQNDGFLPEEGDYVSSNRVDMIISEEQEEEVRDEQEEHVELVDHGAGVGYNPFQGDDWKKFGGIEATQFEEEPSTRQHLDGERQERLLAEEEEVGVIQYKEEPTVEKGQVVPDEEVIEVGGGSGLEEADDDSEEEEGEWKYVSAKPGEGGAVVPEAISPEAALPDDKSCSPALPEQELLVQQDASPSISPALPPRLEHETVETAKVEEFDNRADIGDLKAEEAIADDDKFCHDLGFEVVQKTQAEQSCEAGVLEKPAEEEREPLGVSEVNLLGEKSPQHIEEESEDSTMESRLNPDAAEFVPVSPTQLVSAEQCPGGGDDFDTFKKEADECPGEISEESAVTRTPKAFLNIGLDDNLVLSSSFDHGTPKPADVFQEELSSNVQDLMGSTNDYLMNDENKENISQEGEDKENVSQQITVSDVDSALNRSFEVLEEHSSGNEKVSDFLGSSDIVLGAESKVEPEAVCDMSGRDLMSEFVSGINEPEKSFHKEGYTHEISAHQVVDMIPNETAHTSLSEEISFNKSSVNFMHSSQVEDDVMGQQFIPNNKNEVDEHFKDHFEMEFSPVKHVLPPAVPMEEAELVMVHAETPENLEPIISHPNLPTGPMKTDDFMEPCESVVKEEPIQVELSNAQFGVEDFQKKESYDDLMEDGRQVHNPVESIEHVQTLVANMANFDAEPIVKVEQEFAPLDSTEPVCKSPVMPSVTSELSSIIEGSQSLSLEDKVLVVEEEIQKIENDVVESFNAASEVEVMQEISQSFENEVCSPVSEKITSPEPAVDEYSAKEQVTSEVITPADVSGSEPLVEELPKETAIKESIPEDVSKQTDAGEAAAMAAAAGVALAAAATAVASAAKPAAKKPTTADKKPLSDKSKPSTAAAKPKTTKPPPTTTAAKMTAAPKKPAVPSSTKTASTLAARTATAERKPLASAAKPAPSTKQSPAPTTSLSSKPKTLGAKPSTTATTTSKVGTSSRTPLTRPSTGASSAPKTSTTTTASKPAPGRPSTAPAKTTEPKKMLNGDSTKPASAPTTKMPPLKKTTSASSTVTTKTSTTRVTLTARAAPGKTAADAAKTKPATGTVNGAVPKTAPRTSLASKPSAPAAKTSAPATKPSAPAPARTKTAAAAPTKTTPTAPGIAKKAKESVNKHISATRLSGVGSAKQSAISKTESPKSASKVMTNGTSGKKPEVKSDSKAVEAEEKELRIYPNENGIALDCNNEKLDEVVGIEDAVHEVKEQMVLMGDALTIGEAV